MVFYCSCFATKPVHAWVVGEWRKDPPWEYVVITTSVTTSEPRHQLHRVKVNSIFFPSTLSAKELFNLFFNDDCGVYTHLCFISFGRKQYPLEIMENSASKFSRLFTIIWHKKFYLQLFGMHSGYDLISFDPMMITNIWTITNND